MAFVQNFHPFSGLVYVIVSKPKFQAMTKITKPELMIMRCVITINYLLLLAFLLLLTLARRLEVLLTGTITSFKCETLNLQYILDKYWHSFESTFLRIKFS